MGVSYMGPHVCHHVSHHRAHNYSNFAVGSSITTPNNKDIRRNKTSSVENNRNFAGGLSSSSSDAAVSVYHQLNTSSLDDVKLPMAQASCRLFLLGCVTNQLYVDDDD